MHGTERERAAELKARLRVTLFRLRTSPPGRVLERILWIIIG